MNIILYFIAGVSGSSHGLKAFIILYFLQEFQKKNSAEWPPTPVGHSTPTPEGPPSPAPAAEGPSTPALDGQRETSREPPVPREPVPKEPGLREPGPREPVPREVAPRAAVVAEETAAPEGKKPEAAVMAMVETVRDNLVSDKAAAAIAVVGQAVDKRGVDSKPISREESVRDVVTAAAPKPEDSAGDGIVIREDGATGSKGVRDVGPAESALAPTPTSQDPSSLSRHPISAPSDCAELSSPASKLAAPLVAREEFAASTEPAPAEDNVVQLQSETVASS